MPQSEIGPLDDRILHAAPLTATKKVIVTFGVTDKTTCNKRKTIVIFFLIIPEHILILVHIISLMNAFLSLFFLFSWC